MRLRPEAPLTRTLSCGRAFLLPIYGRLSSTSFPRFATPPQTNVASELLDSHVLAGRGDAACLVGNDFAWSYKELLHTANRIARVLVEDLEVVPGARVMLRAPNTPLMVAAWMAVAKAGGVIVATMPLLRSRELAVIAERARIRLALVDERLSEEMEKLERESREIERVVYFDELMERAAVKSAGVREHPYRDRRSRAHRLHLGNDGKTKRAASTSTGIFSPPPTASSKGPFPARSNDVFAGSPPIAFTFGLGMQVVFPMRVGASIALIEKPSPEALLETVARHGVTVLSTAPTAYRAMLKHVVAKDVGSLRFCVSAGETLPLPTGEAWRESDRKSDRRWHRRDGVVPHLHQRRGRRDSAGCDGKGRSRLRSAGYGRERERSPAGTGRPPRGAGTDGVPLPGRPSAAERVREGRLELHRRRVPDGRGRLLLLPGSHRRYDCFRRIQHLRPGGRRSGSCPTSRLPTAPASRLPTRSAATW